MVPLFFRQMVIKLFLLPVILSSFINVQEIEQESLFRLWLQSPEEQTDDILVFRPDSYELPRVWGREKMEFKNNGEFIYHQIAPEDGYLVLKGTFEFENEKNELHITYIKGNQHIITNYQLIEVTCNILKLKLMKYKILKL